MCKSIFWWTHAYPECPGTEWGTPSHQNPEEAKMIVRVVESFVAEGINPRRITVLCMYKGQMLCVRNLLKQAGVPLFNPYNSPRGVTVRQVANCQLRFCKLFLPHVFLFIIAPGSASRLFNFECCAWDQVLTVDMYQGDENDFVFVSLVRSNAAGKLGFLKFKNRLCVAASRAKCGQYWFGNADLLCRQEHWRRYITALEVQPEGGVGPVVPMRCPRHGAVGGIVSHNSPPVCNAVCGSRLKCGHPCGEECHGDGVEHPRCVVPVAFHHEPCGHAATRKCSAGPGTCDVPCPRTLPCGHPCTKTCGAACLEPSMCTHCWEIHDAQRQAEVRGQEDRRVAAAADVTRQVELIRARAASAEGPVAATVQPLIGPPLPAHAEEFMFVRRLLEAGLSRSDREFPVLTAVRRVKNPGLEAARLEATANLVNPLSGDPVYRYYGHRSLEQELPQLVAEGVPVGRGPYGEGVYLQVSGVKCARISADQGTGKGCMIMCSVQPGEQRPILPVLSDPSLATLARRRDELYDSVCTPHGPGMDAGLLVVFDRHLAIPAFVLEFDMVAVSPARPLPSFTSVTDAVMVKITNDQVLFPFDSEEGAIYRLAESQYLRETTWSAPPPDSEVPWSRPSVTRVDWYRNPQLAHRYELMKATVPGSEQLVFHGTKKENIRAIMQQGFKVGGVDVAVAAGQAHGEGELGGVFVF